PASGVVTALDPVMRACGGVWVAQGSGNADRKFANSKGKLGVPPDDIHYILKRTWLSKDEERGFYYGFSNE
ncbi:MAG TPA: trehalose-6-phosphate synthase, partial [Elusimicrobia bacterium]|nr:trehalose-6-phosphate synthase [Elusimicrobiota bacterium]